MSVFADYSSYYDLLYKDKDYKGEIDYIDMLIRKYNPRAKTILDLGCGTGRHDILLAERGYCIHGVDLSEEMIKIAKQYESSDRLSFSAGDIRNIKCGKKFDVIISLFHVMSYQIKNEDITSVVNTVSRHLEKGGVFIFDCWYGPAVLTDMPVVRVKRLENDELTVLRIAEPVMHPDENVVDVNYQLYITDKLSGNHSEVREMHKMRYWFKPEIEEVLKNKGFELIAYEEWMSGKPTGLDTWGVCWVVKKIVQ
ncbi:MAG: SAM-dependent methyltransferase [Candidatus Margulisiibacteriota bacterium]|nr:MAG: methyltransferase type 11 [Candidatus Margulisbacteria bacterium GWD2_39_127]OGI04776.1 MAG: methyltransferase type 11 [Candidatus Margulisbacteria bacterium GWF2_38_17]OGI05721.1 MAG: methyltransferase type 11 [Candidatus Margulisbacteria bacterium GWE2_39_32]PZM83656.1 MAG: SAM-dependent methyltransferase [Candidatus Margulisiibacteriota bacterium]HAR62074.1 SAM-dependent methyltransferase [Candidatus Margulisiibacteriota bacterium]